MYNGKNKTALNSQLRIKDAFISMLKYSSFDTILIKDICKKANISRQRFYYLYKSKEEIISHILNDFFSNMLDDIKIRNINSLFDLINIFYLSIDANEEGSEPSALTCFKRSDEITRFESVSRPRSPILLKLISKELSVLNVWRQQIN